MFCFLFKLLTPLTADLFSACKRMNMQTQLPRELSLETCPRPLACSWKVPGSQVWEVTTAKGVKCPLWAKVLRTFEAHRKGQQWLSCCNNTIHFKWNAKSLAPPPLSGELLILPESVHMPFSLLCSHTVFYFFFMEIIPHYALIISPCVFCKSSSRTRYIAQLFFFFFAFALFLLTLFKYWTGMGFLVFQSFVWMSVS